MSPFQPDMESMLEWALFLAMGASGLCMFAFVTVLIVDRYRAHRKAK